MFMTFQKPKSNLIQCAITGQVRFNMCNILINNDYSSNSNHTKIPFNKFLWLMLSGRYLDDFQLSQSSTIIKLVNDRIISDVNLYQCAKACVEMEGGSCATFSYCSKVSECRLSTAALSNVGQTGPDAVATCNVYSSKYNPM